MPVKVLYSSAFDAPLSLLGILWRHLQKYIDRQFVELGRTNAANSSNAARPIDIDLCINANGQRVEPVAHLIQVCCRCALLDDMGAGEESAVSPAKQRIFLALSANCALHFLEKIVKSKILDWTKVVNFMAYQALHKKMSSVQYCLMNAAKQ